MAFFRNASGVLRRARRGGVQVAAGETVELAGLDAVYAERSPYFIAVDQPESKRKAPLKSVASDSAPPLVKKKKRGRPRKTRPE